MLILRRKVGESFLVGDQINVTLLGIETNGTVNIGVDAPRDVLILRTELQQAASANQDAAQLSLGALEALGEAIHPATETDGRKQTAKQPQKPMRNLKSKGEIV